MPDLTIKIESEDSPSEIAADIIADEIHDELEEESEIDEKWLDSKFSAIENRVSDLQQLLTTFLESRVSEIPRLTELLMQLSERLTTQAIATAETVSEIQAVTVIPSPEILTEPEPAEIVLPANVEDQKVAGPDDHPRKRRAI